MRKLPLLIFLLLNGCGPIEQIRPQIAGVTWFRDGTTLRELRTYSTDKIYELKIVEKVNQDNVRLACVGTWNLHLDELEAKLTHCTVGQLPSNQAIFCFAVTWDNNMSLICAGGGSVYLTKL